MYYKEKLVLPVLFLLITFAGCNNAGFYQEYRSIPDALWHKDSLLQFNVKVSDTVRNHNLYISVRNEVKYKYRNLWLFIDIEQPGGITATDTFELLLADPTGKWIGKGLSGTKSHQVPYRGNVFFPVSGIYNICIQHGMRDEELEGIRDIGLSIEKTGK